MRTAWSLQKRREALQMLADGLSIQNVATRMNRTDHSMRQTMYRWRKKYGAKNTIHLISISMRKGVIR